MMEKGTLEVIVGPMYAGKTSEILRKILWINYSNQSILVLKPSIDNRYDQENITTHNKLRFPCQTIDTWEDVNEDDLKSQKYHTIVIDEIQFLDPKDTYEKVSMMLSHGVNVIAAGLNQDSRGEPFETTALLMALADEITIVNAVCTVCGKKATKTQRNSKSSSDRILVGSNDVYEPRCKEHWVPV